MIVFLQVFFCRPTCWIQDNDCFFCRPTCWISPAGTGSAAMMQCVWQSSSWVSSLRAVWLLASQRWWPTSSPWGPTNLWVVHQYSLFTSLLSAGAPGACIQCNNHTTPLYRSYQRQRSTSVGQCSWKDLVLCSLHKNYCSLHDIKIHLNKIKTVHKTQKEPYCLVPSLSMSPPPPPPRQSLHQQ